MQQFIEVVNGEWWKKKKKDPYKSDYLITTHTNSINYDKNCVVK